VNIAALDLVNRWIIRQLLNAILRPRFVSYRRALRHGRISAASRGELRFLKLLNSTDCFPFCVTVDEFGLWITDEPPGYDDYEPLGDRYTCNRCAGEGMVDYLDGDGGDWGEDCPSEENHPITCRACNGTGQIQ
jgi:hypothetical protein